MERRKYSVNHFEIVLILILNSLMFNCALNFILVLLFKFILLWYSSTPFLCSKDGMQEDSYPKCHWSCVVCVWIQYRSQLTELLNFIRFHLFDTVDILDCNVIAIAVCHKANVEWHTAVHCKVNQQKYAKAAHKTHSFFSKYLRRIENLLCCCTLLGSSTFERIQSVYIIFHA